MKKYEVSGFEVWEYEELSSTNTQAEQLPREVLKDKMVILTRKQTQGKGQAGNFWESEPGKNLSFTVVLCPQRYEAARQFAVSMAVALGVHDFLLRYVNGVIVKWPNDVYVENKKITGILIEHSVAGAYLKRSLCGIGVNINQEQFRSGAPNPVSLWQLTGKILPLEVALAEVLACIAKRYSNLENYEKLQNDFLASLYRKEGTYAWEDEKGRFQACIRGVDEFGRLMLQDTEGKIRTYGFKEVSYK